MNILLWIFQILLGLLFIFAGASKFFMPADEMAKNMPPYLSIGFIYFIGVCEIVGGLGLIIPWATGIKRWLTPLAAALLVVIMIGATVTTWPMGIGMAAFPLIIGLLLAFIAYGRSRKTVAA